MDIKEKIAELENQLNKLKEECAVNNPLLHRWTPEYYEDYICIQSNGGTVTEENTGHRLDNNRIHFGNCFKTEEEAELHVKRTKLFNLMWAYSDGGGWYINFNFAGRYYASNPAIVPSYSTETKAEAVIQELKPLYDRIVELSK